MVNKHYHAQLGRFESYITNSSLPGNGKPSQSTDAFVFIVREIEHTDVVSARIFADMFRDKGPWAWTTQAVETFLRGHGVIYH
jgi:hypothetical protein